MRWRTVAWTGAALTGIGVFAGRCGSGPDPVITNSPNWKLAVPVRPPPMPLHSTPASPIPSPTATPGPEQPPATPTSEPQ